MKRLSILSFSLISFLFVFSVLPVLRVSAETTKEAEDFSIIIKSSLINKMAKKQGNIAWKDSKTGIEMKLSDLNFNLENGNIIGTANIDEFKRAASGDSKSSAIGSILNYINDLQLKNIGKVEVSTKLGLSDDRKQLVLKDTKFLKIKSKYIPVPAFVEKQMTQQMSKYLSKYLDKQAIYKFSDDFDFDLADIKIENDGIKVSGSVK